MTFREIVQREAKRQKVSGYRLSQLSGIAMRSCQKFLAGDGDVTSDKLTYIARALGLDLMPRAKRKRS